LLLTLNALLKGLRLPTLSHARIRRLKGDSATHWPHVQRWNFVGLGKRNRRSDRSYRNDREDRGEHGRMRLDDRSFHSRAFLLVFRASRDAIDGSLRAGLEFDQGLKIRPTPDQARFAFEGQR
jgi:hypothetical protein